MRDLVRPTLTRRHPFWLGTCQPDVCACAAQACAGPGACIVHSALAGRATLRPWPCHPPPDPLPLQALVAECGLVPTCASWRATQTNPSATIESSLTAGAAALSSWLASRGSNARLCPPVDAGGLLATAGAFPTFLDNLVGLPTWQYGLIMNGALAVCTRLPAELNPES